MLKECEQIVVDPENHLTPQSSLKQQSTIDNTGGGEVEQ